MAAREPLADEPRGAPDPASIRAVALDCYGTLLAFEERHFGPALHAFLELHGIAHVHGDDVWQHWLDAAREHARAHGRDPEKPLDGPEPPFAPFAETWPRFFAHAFAQAGIDRPHHREAFDYIFDRLSQAEAYEEAREVITRLRAAGVPVVVASNADDAHLLPALERTGIEVDAVFSSEGLRSYKPRRPFFEAVARELGQTAESVLYVGDSPYADVTGAHHAGMRSYWVRRYEDERRDQLLKHPPDWTYPDLFGLLDLLLGARG